MNKKTSKETLNPNQPNVKEKQTSSNIVHISSDNLIKTMSKEELDALKVKKEKEEKNQFIRFIGKLDNEYQNESFNNREFETKIFKKGKGVINNDLYDEDSQELLYSKAKIIMINSENDNRRKALIDAFEKGNISDNEIIELIDLSFKLNDADYARTFIEVLYDKDKTNPKIMIEYITRCIKYCNHSDREDALIYFSNDLFKDLDYEVFYLKTCVRIQLYDLAITVLNKIPKEHKLDIRILRIYGIIAEVLGHHEDAVNIYYQIIKNPMTKLKDSMSLAENCYALGRYDEFIEELTAADEKYTHNCLAAYRLALYYYEKTDIETAKLWVAKGKIRTTSKSSLLHALKNLEFKMNMHTFQLQIEMKRTPEQQQRINAVNKSFLKVKQEIDLVGNKDLLKHKYYDYFPLAADDGDNWEILLDECKDVFDKSYRDDNKRKVVRDGKKIRFHIPRSGINLYSSSNDRTVVPVILQIKECQDAKKEFYEIEEYRNFKEFNAEYRYFAHRNSISKEILEDNWDDLNQIFKFCKIPRPKGMDILDVEHVIGHFQCEGEIYYLFNIKNGRNSLFCRMIDCYSFHIFLRIREYLLSLKLNNQNTLAESTIYSEFETYFLVFRKILHADLTMEKLLSATATAYKPMTRVNNMNDNLIIDSEDITRAFITCDGKLGVTINRFPDTKHLMISEFKSFASEKVFDKFFEDINNGIMVCENEKRSMRYLQYLDVLSKKDKTSRNKMINQLRYIEKMYDNNCFFLAASSLSSKITIRNHGLLFKELDITKQIKLLSSICNENGEVLVNINTILGNLYEIVSEIKEPSLITFMVNDSTHHAEAIKDGEPILKVKSNISDFYYLKTRVTIYRIIPAISIEVDDVKLNEKKIDSNDK